MFPPLQNAPHDSDDGSVPDGVRGIVRLDDNLWVLPKSGGKGVGQVMRMDGCQVIFEMSFFAGLKGGRRRRSWRRS